MTGNREESQYDISTYSQQSSSRLNVEITVPRPLPPRRVLLSSICQREHTVTVYHVTTTTGTLYPKPPHTAHPSIYLPVSPGVHTDYLAITPTPPLVRGWCNFAHPAMVKYDDRRPRARLGQGVHNPVGIVLDKRQMDYLRAMTAAWLNTACVMNPVRELTDEARRLRVAYAGESEDHAGKWADEPEWTGLADVRVLCFFRARCVADCTQLPNDTDAVQSPPPPPPTHEAEQRQPLRPRYDRYTASAVFWEISGVQSDAGECSEEDWRVVRWGEPRPMWG